MATRELLSLITAKALGESKEAFLHRASEFLQRATATLEKMPQEGKKQLNTLFNIVFSTTRLIAQNLFSYAAYNGFVLLIRREIRDLLDGNLPEDTARSFDELQRLLDDASQKMKKIQASCSELMEKVKTKCPT